MPHFEYKEKNSIIMGNIMDNVEDVDVKKYLTNFHINSILSAISAYSNRLGIYLPDEDIRTIAIETTKKTIAKTASTPLPQQILDLLDKSLTKKDQIKLLKGCELTAEQLGALFLQAGEKGYKFSNYRFEGKPTQYKDIDLPSFVYLEDDGSVKAYGNSPLTEGQLKDLVQSSNFIVARILDNGSHWHCFFQTQRGVLGKEPGEYGHQSHIHYISDSFGVTKKDLVSSIKCGHYPLTKVHILLK